MKAFFRTWIDWWLFIPLSLIFAVTSYWFVPAGLSYLGIAEQDMSYTGTAWAYSLFQVLLVFMLGLGASFVVFRFFFPNRHKYLESDQFEKDVTDPTKKFEVALTLTIPAVIFIGFCILCTAVF